MNEPSRLFCDNMHPIELCTCKEPGSPSFPVDKVVSLRLECRTCRSSKIMSIETNELYCKIHKENRNKFCINWNPSRFSIKAYLLE